MTLQWDPSPEADVAGYKVYYGTASGQYQSYVDVGKTTLCTLSNLQDGVPYYFAATVYDQTNSESDFSSEVTFGGGGACAFSLSPASQSFSSSGGSGGVTLSTGSGCLWTAVGNAPWITLTSNSSGTGSGAVYYSVSANSSGSSRSGTLTIGEKSFTVNQQGVSLVTLNLTKTGTGSGTISQNPAGTSFSPGTVVTLKAAPDVTSVFSDWSGACTGASDSCVVTLNSSTSVTAAFTLKNFTLQASAGSNGVITPAGSVLVPYGGSQGFSILPATGYGVSDVRVDGVSIGQATSYLFGNVQAGHTLTASFAALSPPTDFALGLNAGGGEYQNATGSLYRADQYYQGGAAGSTPAVVRNTVDGPLYQDERYGNFSYAIPVASGSYDLTLKFVENFHTAANRRVFDVFAEGILVLKGLDIYAAAGTNRALDITFTVSVFDGVLNLDFVPRTGDAQVSAILVKKASGDPIKPPRNLKRYFTILSRTNP